LLTDEVVEQMRIKLPLLADGMGAISFYREEIERAVKLRSTHAKLAPLIQQFLEEVLFGQAVTLYDPRLIARLADPDVREHVRAVFVPIILGHITEKTERLPESDPQSVCAWKPFQATHSERHPAEIAGQTPFNLVPCTNQLEVALAHFADSANDVAAFAKNAGPQALRIDYLGRDGRRASYTPDFLVRKKDGHYFLVETKGRADRDVPAKARAAVEWCKAASTKKVTWEYLYVPEEVFERVSGNSVGELARACAPALAEILREGTTPQLTLRFDQEPAERVAEQAKAFLDAAQLESLPQRYKKAVEHAISLFHFHEKKEGVTFGPVFQPLLGCIDHAAESILIERLSPLVPTSEAERKDFFEPDVSSRKKKEAEYVADIARRLQKLLVYRAPMMPTGLLVNVLEHAGTSKPLGGVLGAVVTQFAPLLDTPLRTLTKQVYDFRNDYIAHEKKELNDVEVTRTALKTWVEDLVQLNSARLGTQQ
jgi:type III restriction enzyme